MVTKTPNGLCFESGCEIVDVTRSHRPDTSWWFADAAGHEHCWYVNGKPAGPYDPSQRYDTPTLKWVKTGEAYWPDADEPHDIGHHECKDCGEVIEPRFCADSHKQTMPGLRWFKINGESVSPEEFKAQYEQATRS